MTATATLAPSPDKGTENVTANRKASAASEITRRSDTPEAILTREMIASMREKGGQFNLLNETEVGTLTEMFFGSVAALGWCIHKDYPVCTECREKVKERATTAKEWGRTEGSAIAARMILEAQAGKPKEGE